MTQELNYRNNPNSLFRKYARLVTWFANTPSGRQYITSKYKKLRLPNQPFDLFLPNGYRIITGIYPLGRGKWHVQKKTVVTTRPVFSRNVLLEPLQQFDLYAPYVKNIEEAKSIFNYLVFGSIGSGLQIPWQVLGIVHTVTTVYPNPDPETTTCDGRVFLDGVSQTWAAIRAATDGNGSSDTTNGEGGVLCAQILTHGSTNPNWGTFIRGFFGYDATSIDDADVISDVDNDYWVNTKNDAFSDSISLVLATPASPTALGTADYDQLGTTKQATDLTIAGLTTGAYNTFSWLEAQLTNVSKTAVIKTGLRSTRDNDNSEPSWGANQYSGIAVDMADSAGTTEDPKLVINHAAVVTGRIAGELMMMGVGR